MRVYPNIQSSGSHSPCAERKFRMNTAVTSLPLSPAGDASATPGARLRQGFARVGGTVWKALEAAGRARAERHLMDFADRCEGYQPELAKELRAAARQGPMA
jgi:hypothetical protein